MKWPWTKGTVQTGQGKEMSGRFYVYHLRYPYDLEVFGHNAGRIFYTGKGSGERLLNHERETRRILKANRLMELHHKHKVIIEIWDAGFDVVQEIVYRTDDEEDAYQAESHHIREIGLDRLTNETYGWRPKRKRGDA